MRQEQDGSLEIVKRHEVQRETESEERALREKVYAMLRESYAYFIKHSDLPIDQAFPFRASFGSTNDLLVFLSPDDHAEEGDSVIHLEQRKRVDLFFQTLLDFVRDMRSEPNSRQYLEEYCAALRERGFSFTPNIFDYLSLEGQVIAALQVSKIPEMQGSLGQNMIGELTYNIQFGMSHEERMAFIDRLLQQLPFEQRLDFIHFLPTIVTDAAAQGWADDVVRATEASVKKLSSDTTASPFLTYASAESLAIIQQEREHPSRGVAIRYGDPGISRRYDAHFADIVGDHVVIDKVIQPNEGSYLGGVFQVLARDAVGSYDHALTLQSVAHVSASQFSAIENAVASPQQSQSVILHFDLVERATENKKILPKDSVTPVNTAILLQEMHRPGMRNALEADLGISLVDLSLREQIQLLTYLAGIDAKTAKKGFAVINGYGVDCARAFLSCEYGKKYGDAILAIGERLPPQAAKAIFAKYCEIADFTERVTDDALGICEKVPSGSEFRDTLHEEFLSHAKDVLAKYASFPALFDEKGSATIKRELEIIKGDVVLLGAVFRELNRQQQKVALEDIRGLELKRRAPAEVPEKTRETMKLIFDLNWRDQDVGAAAIFKRAMIEKLQSDDAETSFYLLEHNGELVGFMRFDERPDLGKRALYAGSLNIHPHARGKAIGEAMMQRTLDEQARDHVLHAHTVPTVLVGTNYIERHGFVITGVEEKLIDSTQPDGPTVPLFTIVRDDARWRSLKSRQSDVDQKRLIAGEIQGVRVQYFDVTTQKEQFLAAVAQASAHGEVVARYWADAKNPSIRYLAFEKSEPLP